MTDIYNTDLADTVLDLENNLKFIKELERLAAQATPSFYKYNLKGKVLFDNSEGGFLSYSTKEVFSAAINDTIRKYSNITNPLIKEHFLEYYITEIKLGACFLDINTTNVLNMRKIRSKAEIAKSLNITLYKLDKIFESFPTEVYERFSQVNHGVSYDQVMVTH